MLASQSGDLPCQSVCGVRVGVRGGLCVQDFFFYFFFFRGNSSTHHRTQPGRHRSERDTHNDATDTHRAVDQRQNTRCAAAKTRRETPQGYA